MNSENLIHADGIIHIIRYSSSTILVDVNYSSFQKIYQTKETTTNQQSQYRKLKDKLSSRPLD